MISTTEKKTCLACGKVVKGRIDKKFCDDACRNNYNNIQNSDATNYVRNINNALRKNRRILEEYFEKHKNESGIAKVTKTKLTELGFIFKYLTNTLKTKDNKVYLFVYEYGYLPLENDWLMVVKKKDE